MSSARAHERSAFGLRLAKASHPDLRRLRGLDSPRSQGHKAWNAGWLLIDFLQRQKLPKGLRVLDAGCGWGLCGIFCARHLAALVTAADIDPRVFPYLNLHAQLNEVEIATRELGFAQIASDLLAEQDLVIGADICFRENMVPPVQKLIERALSAGVRRLLLADPGRPSFRHLSSYCVENLTATTLDWSVAEPLIEWSGQRPLLKGQLLLIGDWPTPSPA